MPTDYVVLRFDSEEDLKTHIAGTATASSERQARKEFVDNDQQITVCIPARSFKPERRKRTTKPVDTFETVGEFVAPISD
jgi:hypothetical protein